MHLIKPAGRSRQWKIHAVVDGRGVKIPGDRNRDMARTIMRRCEALLRAKETGDSPPGDLMPWIQNMRPALAERLTTLGLLQPEYRARAQSIAQHIADYEAAVASRRGNTQKHATQSARYVTRVCEALNVGRFRELREDDVLRHLADEGRSLATRHHYLVALCNFCRWMVRTKRATENPMPYTPKPSATADEQHVRRPLTVEEFRRLLVHLRELDTAGGLYPYQRAQWTANDRVHIYWTAVSTAYRLNELRSLRRHNLLLDQEPAVITLAPVDTKNRQGGEIPIPADLAASLREYIEDHEPGDPVFLFPEGTGTVVRMLRRDLGGAGVAYEDEGTGLVDFHALRSTAITWWLDVYAIRPKRVQILARLRSLELVSRYSRSMRLETYDHLERAPSLGAEWGADWGADWGAQRRESSAKRRNGTVG